MYWSEITTRLAGGRSTPEIRAIVSLPFQELVWSRLFLAALALLVPRVRRADHPDDALAAKHLALVTNLLHRRANLHDFIPFRELLEELLSPVGDATPGQV